MDRQAFGYLVATCCDILGVGGSNFTNFKLEPTIPTCRNTSKQGGQTGATSNAQQCCHRIAETLHYVETCEDFEQNSRRFTAVFGNIRRLDAKKTLVSYGKNVPGLTLCLFMAANVLVPGPTAKPS